MNLTNPTITVMPNGYTVIKHTCVEPDCDTITTGLVLDPDAVDMWRSGRYSVQECFPRLSDTQREALFVTGICGRCWDKMFPEEEEEEDWNEPEYYDPAWDYPSYDPQTSFYEATGRMQFPNEY